MGFQNTEIRHVFLIFCSILSSWAASNHATQVSVVGHSKVEKIQDDFLCVVFESEVNVFCHLWPIVKHGFSLSFYSAYYKCSITWELKFERSQISLFSPFSWKFSLKSLGLFQTISRLQGYFFRCAWICLEHLQIALRFYKIFPCVLAFSIFYIYQKFKMQAWM